MAGNNLSRVATYDFDLFISYATADDEAGGWVTRLREELSFRLRMITGTPPRIFFDTTNELGLDTGKPVLSSALLLIVISPSYLASARCHRELETFVKHAGADRVVRVVKFPVNEALPLPLVVGHDFYRRESNRLAHELEGDKYRRALDTLAQDIRLLLQSLLSPHSGPALLGNAMEVFLCHASGDKSQVRELWGRLRTGGFAPWLDSEDILPGQKWELEIQKAIDRAGAVIVCLSNGSVNKEGFLQREIKQVLDKAAEKPDDAIFLIPARLEDCSVPIRLKNRQWVDLFEPAGYNKLLQALQLRDASLRPVRRE